MKIVDCRKEIYDVYIGRPSIFGNPFTKGKRTDLIARYEKYFLMRVKIDPLFREEVLKLRGKTLGCFCAPRPCHGQIIIDWLEANETFQSL